jgi:ADP-ribosylglycohydrolase
MDQVVEQARLSAEVTHMHREGVAGAIAVAVAAAWAQSHRQHITEDAGRFLLETVVEHTPSGQVRDGIRRAAELPGDYWEQTAANALGNGSEMTAMDTVPFCVWCAAAHLDDYAEAIWTAVHVQGDIDTNCAIIGGIVALAVGREGLPEEWLRRRESLFRG